MVNKLNMSILPYKQKKWGVIGLLAFNFHSFTVAFFTAGSHGIMMDAENLVCKNVLDHSH